MVQNHKYSQHEMAIYTRDRPFIGMAKYRGQATLAHLQPCLSPSAPVSMSHRPQHYITIYTFFFFFTVSLFSTEPATQYELYSGTATWVCCCCTYCSFFNIITRSKYFIHHFFLFDYSLNSSYAKITFLN